MPKMNSVVLGLDQMQVKDICNFENSELSSFSLSLTLGQENTIITFLKLLINSDLKIENRFSHFPYFATF